MSRTVQHGMLKRSSNSMGSDSQCVNWNTQKACQFLASVHLFSAFTSVIFQYQEPITRRQLFYTAIQPLVIIFFETTWQSRDCGRHVLSSIFQKNPFCHPTKIISGVTLI